MRLIILIRNKFSDSLKYLLMDLLHKTSICRPTYKEFLEKVRALDPNTIAPSLLPFDQ